MKRVFVAFSLILVTALMLEKVPAVMHRSGTNVYPDSILCFQPTAL